MWLSRRMKATKTDLKKSLLIYNVLKNVYSMIPFYNKNKIVCMQMFVCFYSHQEYTDRQTSNC